MANPEECFSRLSLANVGVPDRYMTSEIMALEQNLLTMTININLCINLWSKITNTIRK